MLARLISVGVFISFFTIMLFAAPSLAQNLTPELQKTFLKQLAFGATDFAALERGEPAVTLLPVNHKREIAVYGFGAFTGFG